MFVIVSTNLSLPLKQLAEIERSLTGPHEPERVNFFEYMSETGLVFSVKGGSLVLEPRDGLSSEFTHVFGVLSSFRGSRTYVIWSSMCGDVRRWILSPGKIDVLAIS